MKVTIRGAPEEIAAVLGFDWTRFYDEEGKAEQDSA